MGKKTLSTHHIQRSFAIGMLDMNCFKLINDTYGHYIGDKLLIEKTRRLRANFREGDVVARLGGDEFAILWDDAGIVTNFGFVLQCRESDEAEGRPLDAILNRVFDQPYSLGDGVLLDNVKGSLGIALYPGHGLDLETLLKHADQTMYQANRRGWGLCFCI